MKKKKKVKALEDSEFVFDLGDLDVPKKKPRRKRHTALGISLDYKKSKTMAKAIEREREQAKSQKLAAESLEIGDLFDQTGIDQELSYDITKEKPSKKKPKVSLPGSVVKEAVLPSEKRAKEVEEWQKTQGTGQDGATKKLNITIDYDPNSLPPVSQMLMEIVSSRIQQNYAEKDIDYWWNYMNKVGSVPFLTVMKDEPRYWTLIYAAEFIRMHPGSDAEHRTLDSRPIENPDYNPYERNVAQEGNHWGIQMEAPPVLAPRPALETGKAQSDDPFAPNFVARDNEGNIISPRLQDAVNLNPDLASTLGLIEDTKLSKIAPISTAIIEEKRLAEPGPLGVREQVEKAAEENLESFLKDDQPKGEVSTEAIGVPDGLTLKWQEADRLALLPREAWENAPYQLRKMVQWCYGHRMDTSTAENQQGEVTEFPTDMALVYTYRPKFVDKDPEVVQRRNEMRDKVLGFWNKSVEANRDKINLDSKSYRVQLGATGLSKMIDEFANNRVDENAVKHAAMRFFQAHFPVETLGANPGPVSTLDPTYEEYIKLCTKYNLEVGVLLHEKNL